MKYLLIKNNNFGQGKSDLKCIFIGKKMKQQEVKEDDTNSQQSTVKKQAEVQKRQSQQNSIIQQVKIEQQTRLKTCRTKVNVINIPKNKEEDKSDQINLLDPDEQDLCKALTLLKNKLPNRSLLQTIKRLYQTVQLQQKQQQKSQFFRKKTLSNAMTEELTNNKDGSVKSSQKARSEGVSFPNKKGSPYHDKVGEISGITHEFYRTNNPINENQTIHSKNIVSATQLKYPVESGSSEGSQRQLSIQPKRKSIIFHFKEQNTLKTKFLNPLQEEKYKQRRQLTKIYIERGYGVTKEIDEQLPAIGIERNKYKNLLGGVLTMAYRKLQSFIFSQCGKSIKYLNRQQMKSIATMLLNCRVQLSPTMCDTYFKFMRVGFGIGDVDISDEEAVELYVGIHKFIHGKSITMDMLQNMGRVQNLRELQATAETLDAKAERFKCKMRETYSSDCYNSSTCEKADSQAPDEVKEQYISALGQQLQTTALPNKIGLNLLSSLEDNDQLIDLRKIHIQKYREDNDNLVFKTKPRSNYEAVDQDQKQMEESLFLLQQQIDPSFLQEINL